MMLKHWDSYFLDVIHGKRTGLSARCLRGILLVLSWGFKGIVSCRNWAFDRGWLRRYYPPVPVVISIGNIVVGGTGKTPVTLKIAQEFYEKYSVGILSRGYRSPAERLPSPIVVSKGEGPLHPASYCGDEPYLLAKNLPKAFVFVGKNRHQASNLAAKAGVELILLDDGMQHRYLARDFDIVVVDAHNPMGSGHFLPRGLLREGIQSLSRASLVICNHVSDKEKFIVLKRMIQQHTTAPIVAATPVAVKVRDLQGNPREGLKDQPVGIFCGISQPEHFKNMVLQQGAHVVAQHFVADHSGVSKEELAQFVKISQERGAKMVVCTEKDWVKLDEKDSFALPVVWIQMQLQWVEGEEHWIAFIEKVKQILEAI